jgi:hypothetical protein
MAAIRSPTLLRVLTPVGTPCNAPVAQMAEASPSDGEGWGFESLAEYVVGLGGPNGRGVSLRCWLLQVRILFETRALIRWDRASWAGRPHGPRLPNGLVAQRLEHHLVKVGNAGSNPVWVAGSPASWVDLPGVCDS